MSCWRGLALASTLLGLAQGCAGPSDDSKVAKRSLPIIDGDASDANEDGVVMIRAVLDDDREMICSATLIAPNLLITARHCVSYLTDGLFSCSVEGELTNSQDGAGTLGLHLPPEAIEVYGKRPPRDEPLARGHETISTLSDTICNNDLAFVVLDTALDLPLTPLRIGRPAELDELTVMVGYGLARGQQGIDYRYQSRMHKADLLIAGVGPDSLEEGVTTVPPRTLFIDGPSGCIGDSGGPLLSQATGALLGVFSLQEGESCTATNVRQHLVHVPPFERLISDAFEAAGAEPLLEPGVGGAGGEAASSAGGAATTPEPTTHGGEGGVGIAEPEPKPPAAGDDSGCAVTASGARRAGRPQAWVPGLPLGLALVLARRRRARALPPISRV